MRRKGTRSALSALLAAVMICTLLPGEAAQALSKSSFFDHNHFVDGMNHWPQTIMNMNPDYIDITFTGGNESIIPYPDYERADPGFLYGWAEEEMDYGFADGPRVVEHTSGLIIAEYEARYADDKDLVVGLKVTGSPFRGASAVPIVAMVDGAYLDQLTNDPKGYDVKRWAAGLLERDYSLSYPGRGAMLAPDEIAPGFRGRASQLRFPGHVAERAYRKSGTTAPGENPYVSGAPMLWPTQVLVADLVPYEANTISARVTGPSEMTLNTRGAISGANVTTLEITNNASYPQYVLASLFGTQCLSHTPAPDYTIDSLDFFGGQYRDEETSVLYLPPGETRALSYSFSMEDAQARKGDKTVKAGVMPYDATLKFSFRVLSLTAMMSNEDHQMAEDQTLTHTTFYPGNKDYVDRLMEDNASTSILVSGYTPTAINAKDAYDLDTLYISGENLDKVERVVIRYPKDILYSSAEEMISSSPVTVYKSRPYYEYFIYSVPASGRPGDADLKAEYVKSPNLMELPLPYRVYARAVQEAARLDRYGLVNELSLDVFLLSSYWDEDYVGSNSAFNAADYPIWTGPGGGPASPKPFPAEADYPAEFLKTAQTFGGVSGRAPNISIPLGPRVSSVSGQGGGQGSSAPNRVSTRLYMDWPRNVGGMFKDLPATAEMEVFLDDGGAGIADRAPIRIEGSLVEDRGDGVYFIQPGCTINGNLEVRADPSYAGSAEQGIRIARSADMSDGTQFSFSSKGCTLWYDNTQVMGDFTLPIYRASNGLTFTTAYPDPAEVWGEAFTKNRQFETLRLEPAGGETYRFISPELGIDGQVTHVYLYMRQIGLGLLASPQGLMPPVVEDYIDGAVTLDELRLPIPPAYGVWGAEMKGGVKGLKLGGDFLIFEAGGNLDFSIDTREESENKHISFQGDANFFGLFTCAATMHCEFQNGSYVLDRIDVRGGSELIGLLPPTPLIVLYEVGGGAEGIAQTISGEDWSYLPPIVVYLDASIKDAAGLLDVNRAGFALGPTRQEVYLNELRLLNCSFAEDLSAGLYWEEGAPLDVNGSTLSLPKVTMDARGTLHIGDFEIGEETVEAAFFDGTGYFAWSLDTREFVKGLIDKDGSMKDPIGDWMAANDTDDPDYLELFQSAVAGVGEETRKAVALMGRTMSVNGRATGDLYVPKAIPLVGGVSVADSAVALGWNSPNLMLSSKLNLFDLGVIDLRFTYNANTHDVSLGSGGRARTLAAPSGEPEVTLRNVRFLEVVEAPASDAPLTPIEEELAAEDPAAEPEAETAAEGETEHGAPGSPDPGEDGTDVPAAALTPEEDEEEITLLSEGVQEGNNFEVTLTGEEKGRDLIVSFRAAQPVAFEAEAKCGDAVGHPLVVTTLEDADPTKGWSKVKENEYRFTCAFLCSRHDPVDTITFMGIADKVAALEVAALLPPERFDVQFTHDLNQAGFQVHDPIPGTDYQVEVRAVPAADVVNFEPTAAGVPVARSQTFRPENGSYTGTITLPADWMGAVQSGEYRYVVSLMEVTEGGAVPLGPYGISLPLQATNPHAPAAAPAGFQSVYAGNGYHDMSFTLADAANLTGVEVALRDGQGDPIPAPQPTQTTRAGDPDPVQKPDAYPYEPLLDLTTAADGGLTAEGTRYSFRLLRPAALAGDACKLVLTPYALRDGVRYYGPPLTADADLQAPAPASATVSDDGDFSPVAGEPGRYQAVQRVELAQENGVYRLATQKTEVSLTATPHSDVAFTDIVLTGPDGTVIEAPLKPGDSPAPTATLDIPLKEGRYTVRAETVTQKKDTNVQTWYFDVISDTAPLLYIDDDSVSLTAGGEIFFTGLIGGAAKLGQVGGQTVDVTPGADGSFSYRGDHGISPVKLTDPDTGADTGYTRYTIGVTARDSLGRETAAAIIRDVPTAPLPKQLRLSVTNGGVLPLAPDGLTGALTASLYDPAYQSGEAVTTGMTCYLTEVGEAVDYGSFAWGNAVHSDTLSVSENGAKLTPKSPGQMMLHIKYTPQSGGPYYASTLITVQDGPVLPTLRVAEVGADSVRLDYAPGLGVPDTAGAVVRNGSTTVGTVTASGAAHSFTVGGLEPGTDYTLHLEVVLTDGRVYGKVSPVRFRTLPLPPENTVTVTYLQDDGAVRLQSLYEPGDTVRLLQEQATGLPGDVAPALLGWSTEPNGGGTAYRFADGQTSFTMGSENVLLYPIRTSGGGDTPTGGGGSSGSSPATQAVRAVERAKDGDTVKLDLPRDGKLPAQVLEAAAGRDVTLEIAVGKGLTWVISGLDIPAGKRSALDLGVEPGAGTIPVALVNALSGERRALLLELSHDGPFPFPLVLRLEVGAESAGWFANLYYHDEAAGALEFRAAARIGPDGAADLPFAHASGYAVVIDASSHAPLPFADVGEADWFREAVRYVYGQGLMTGTDGGLFRPEGAVTRAQVWTVLARLAGAGTGGGEPWYAPARAWAVDKGVSDGTDPDGAVTREQLVTMLYRYARSAGRDVSGEGEAALAGYADASAVAEWAAEGFQWACGAGIVQGVGGNRLAPQAGATRAELAALLQRWLTRS